MAKINNPFASLGNLTYVADALIDEVSASAGRDMLTEAGASGYQVALADPDQSPIPPAIDVSGTGVSKQAAIQSVQLVTNALVRDLNEMQSSQNVQSKNMITGVEYVTPTSASKVSSGSVRVAAGVVAVGLIALLVAVSIAQGREEQNRRSRRESRSAYREGVHREPTESASEFSHDYPTAMPSSERLPMTRMSVNYPAGPARAAEMQPIDSGSRHWGRSG